MAKTTAEINKELTIYQCCIADRAISYILRETTGQYNLDCELNKIIAATKILENLKCPDTIIDTEQLTQDELEATLEQLSNFCGCMNCMSAEEIIDDTLPSGLNTLLEDDENPILWS